MSNVIKISIIFIAISFALFGASQDWPGALCVVFSFISFGVQTFFEIKEIKKIDLLEKEIKEFKDRLNSISISRGIR